MSQTIVDIANAALLKLGASPIMSLEDGTKEAATCKIRYQFVKEAVLRMHPWNSASKRMTLSPTSTAPDFGYAYQFPLPTDYVRTIKSSAEDYCIEGKQVLSNDTSIDLKYVSGTALEGDLDPLLCDAIATRLAWDICYPITQSLSLKESLEQDLRKAVQKAKVADAQDEPADVVEAEEFLLSRLSPTTDREPKRNW